MEDKTMELQKEQGAFDRLLQDDVIDLRQYWQTIMRHKWGIMGFSFIVTVLTVLVVFAMKPIYKATATLLIESQQAKVVSIEEVYGLEGNNSEYFLTQFEILKSRKLAEKVVSQFDLVNHPEFNEQPMFSLDFDWKQYLPFELPGANVTLTPEQIEEARFKAAVDLYLSRLSVEPVRKTQLVNISYESGDPQLAADIANAVGNAYIEDNLQSKLDLTVKASSWLSQQLEGLRSQVTDAEQRLQEYRDEQGIVGDNGGLKIANRELDLVSEKLVEARRDRLEQESIYRQIQAARGKPSLLEMIPSILQHPLVQGLKQSVTVVELKKSELAKRYGAKHPAMQAVNSELSSARSNLNSQIISVAKGIENNYKVALANEQSLQGTLQGTKGNIQSLSRKEYKLRELQQDVDTKRALYDTFFTRFNETNATGDLKTANARIADPAVVPALPEKPKKKLIVVLAFVVSAMFGVMFAFLLQALNNTVKTASEVESRLNATMLGLLPLLPKQRKGANQSYTQFIKDPQSAFAESLRTIRTGVVLSALDSPHKVLSVTSTVPGEGKTSMSLGLAFALGQMEKVLLIDGDMRRPSIARGLGLDPKSPGLSALVAGTASLEECIQTFGEGNIDVMTAGIIPPNPSELLSSKRFAKVLEVLETKYDRIIIDTAPCQAVSDAMIMAPLVGAMIYVVKADSTPYQHAKNGLKRLREVKAPVIGVVLNQVDVKKGAKYYGQEYGGYYDVYGYSGSKA